MDYKLLVYILLFVGLLAMFALLLCRSDQYDIKKNKIIYILIPLFFSGYFGTKLLFLIENGYYGGQSYYGAIFFVPVVFAFISSRYEIGYGKLLSFCAPCGCLIHIIMKIACLMSGCCGGNALYRSYSVIPLQMMEALVSFTILVILLLLEKNEKHKNSMYGWYMLLQGATRLILNSFRDNISVFIVFPAGHFWSLISIFLAVLYLNYYQFINLKIKDYSCNVNSIFDSFFKWR